MVCKVAFVGRLDVAPEVVLKKLTLLKQHLNYLKLFENITRLDFEKNYDTVERIIELMVFGSVCSPSVRA